MYKLLTRLMELWVKPDILPADPNELIKAELPVLYVLEVGGAADRVALQIATTRFGLKNPGNKLTYGNLTESSSVDVLQRRQGTVFRKHRWVISRRLSRLVEESATSQAGEVQIVPVSVYWGRAPGKDSSVWKLLFSENWQFAGRTRKFLSTLFLGRHTLVSFSEPLSIQTLIQSGEPTPVLTRKLARILRTHFRNKRVASLGPDQSHRRMLVDHVLSDPSVRKAMDLDGGSTGRERIRRRARRYANEIAADVSYPTVRVLHRLLTRLWNELYDGVELDGIDRLKTVADGRQLVYVPCHRSHIDYLLLSYILYVQGLSIPHIAAGINLNLPVIGSLLRRGGAFFLRRSFAGKPLYAAVFNAYLKLLVQRGQALEYFIEGGRSRTGRLLPPKAGMLAMTVSAYLESPNSPVAFIPVYFGYERLLEGRAFTSELAGGKKQRESLFGLFKSLKTLRENYGKVYVNFGQAVELDKLLDTCYPQWRKEDAPDKRSDWFKSVVDTLGNSIMHNINAAASVTPVSILATVMLATPRGCIDRNELIKELRIYHKLLEGTHAGTLIVIPAIDAHELIDHGCRLGFIELVQDQLGTIVQIADGQSAPLTYFKNNILHLLTLPALIAASLANQKYRHQHEIQHLIDSTFPVIQSELFQSIDLTEHRVRQALTGLSDAGLIVSEGENWSRPQIGSIEAICLLRLAQVVTPALERDYLCACLLAQSATEALKLSELARQCEACADRLALTHGRISNELYDKHLHNSFIMTLEQLGFVVIENNTVAATAKLYTMENEARALLPESTRHAIIEIVMNVNLT
ncbi:MAG: glycerol-3-phosphate 1-O-acyltransferase PlsB [Granulosicoccus sp.]